VERHERQVRRRARCWEWLKTRSDKRIRSNLEGSEEVEDEEVGNKDEGEEPHVKPCYILMIGLLQRDLDASRAKWRTHGSSSFGDFRIGRDGEDVDVDILLDVLHECRVGEIRYHYLYDITSFRISQASSRGEISEGSAYLTCTFQSRYQSR